MKSYPELPIFDLDDALIQAVVAHGVARMRVFRHVGTAVVLGRGSGHTEADLAACARDGVPVLRRHGGGCAVLLDPGNVIVSLGYAAEGILGSRTHFERISDWLIAGLSAAGVSGVRREGMSDLALGDRKIAGACIYRAKNILYYSASLLVDPDLTAVERYLHHPPREPEYRRGRSHREFMGSLKPLLRGECVASFAERLSAALAEHPLAREPFR